MWRMPIATRDPSPWAFAILVLAGALCTNAGANCILSAQDRPNAASGAQVQVTSISVEEFNNYNAAMNESDPQKRAAKLYAFVQKYPKSILVERISNEDYQNIKVIEDAYNAFYAAKREPDLEKRAAMLLDLRQKYPQSIITDYIHNEYIEFLEGIYGDKKYELLDSFGEKWLTVYPHDTETCALVAEAAIQLHKYQRCGECLETVYETKPSPSLAREIQVCYGKANNPVG